MILHYDHDKCINDRKCLEYEKRYFALEIIKTIATPKMVLVVGIIILTAIQIIKGG